MSNQRKKLMFLIKTGDFKEARRFIRTLNHPKRDELLRRVDIAEEKYKHKTASRRENLDIIEHLIDRGHFEKARRFVGKLNHPKKTELLLKIEDKRQTDTMKAIVIGKKVETEPDHPLDILQKHPFGFLGTPISFFTGLRVLAVLRNYQRMGRNNRMWIGSLMYVVIFGLFIGLLLTTAIRATFQIHTQIE